MGIVSKMLSVLGMGQSNQSPPGDDTSESDSQAFGEKSMDDLLRDEDDEDKS